MGKVLDHEHEWETVVRVSQGGPRIVWYCDDPECGAWTVTEQEMENLVKK